MRFAEVILPVPVGRSFTYSVPPEMADHIGVGCRVMVPFGKGKMQTGIVLSLRSDAPEGDFETRPVRELVDTSPVVGERELRLWQWMADYYMCALGDVMKAALPSGMKLDGDTLTETYRPKTETHVRLSAKFLDETALNEVFESLRRTPRRYALLLKLCELASVETALKLRNPQLLEEVSRSRLLKESGASAAVLTGLRAKGIVETYEVEVGRLGKGAGSVVDQLPLSSAQQEACDSIVRQWREKRVCLLHGVTSSGKTEIYIRLIRQALSEGKQVLYLLPEIALTTQITQRLRRVFGDEMGVYHSKFSDAERVEMWQKQVGDKPFGLVVGVRSALFLPQQRLGLIIVDEEHETSYKQQDPAPRYNARDAAVVMAQMHGARVLLGTATPSLESYYNASVGKYGYVRIDKRYGDIMLPQIDVIDVQDLQRRKLMRQPFSPQLEEEMRQALQGGEQVILFQNRRGYAPVVECAECGWVPTCEYCDVSLTYHNDDHRLHCHYCGNTFAIPHECPNCGGRNLRSFGFGTEKIEEEVHKRFPQARTARLDLDTTRSRNSYRRIIDDFSDGKTDVLIGTQMVSKGLDFGNVRVVGILDADTMLNRPDFRCHERAFQMMSQVAGRAGRRSRRGHVILQTRRADSELVAQVMANDYEGMCQAQLAERKQFFYPPFYRLIYVWIKHRDELVAAEAARQLAQQMLQRFGGGVLGPDKPAVAKVQMKHIRKVALKVSPAVPTAEVRARLHAAADSVLATPRLRSAIIYFDVDPL